jgi:hypothetical protein
MNTLISILHEGGFSCVIQQGGAVRTFTQRGVADLFQLLTTDAPFLLGSRIADKVVGKGAAALMVKGGVSQVYADVISAPALALLQGHGVVVTYAELAEGIRNRTGTDMCPVEKRCLSLENIDEMVGEIGAFLMQMREQYERK